MEIGGILMPADLGADPRLFEEIHRLKQQRPDQAKDMGQIGQAGPARNPVEPGSRSWSAWPILFNANRAGWSVASSSKKKRTAAPDSRK